MMIWGVATASVLYGFYRLGSQNQERTEEAYRERQARYAMAPILQAETDAAYLKTQAELKAYEAEVMKDVKGFTPGKSVYFTDRWVPTQLSPLVKHGKK